MTKHLRNQGYWVNPKRTARLMRVMGLQAVVPKRRMTRSNPDHKVYPYLLRNVPIIRANQVWSDDITYVPTGIHVSCCPGNYKFQWVRYSAQQGRQDACAPRISRSFVLV